MPTNEVDGIDDENNMVGVFYSWVDSANHGFLLSGDKQTTFDYPDAPYTSASGVFGSVVIGWISFDFPEAVSTANYGISNDGTIAGSYLLNNVTHGFLAVPGALK